MLIKNEQLQFITTCLPESFSYRKDLPANVKAPINWERDESFGDLLIGVRVTKMMVY